MISRRCSQSTTEHSDKYFVLRFVSKRVWFRKPALFLFTFDQKITDMVEYNELKLSDDRSELSIDLGVDSSHYLGDIWLEYYKNRRTTNEKSSKAFMLRDWDGETEERSFSRDVTDSELSIDENGVDTFERGLFYVMVEVFDSDSDTPTTEVAAVLDYDWLYAVGMNIIGKFASMPCDCKCDDHPEMKQFILVWHALGFALEAKDLDMVDKLWGRFVDISDNAAGSPCECGYGSN